MTDPKDAAEAVRAALRADAAQHRMQADEQLDPDLSKWHERAAATALKAANFLAALERGVPDAMREVLATAHALLRIKYGNTDPAATALLAQIETALERGEGENERGPQTPLSPEEFAKIVEGNTPPPASGGAPSRVTVQDYNEALDAADEALGGAFKDGFREGWIFAQSPDGSDYEELGERYKRAVDIEPSEAWDGYRDTYFAKLPLAKLPTIGALLPAAPPREEIARIIERLEGLLAKAAFTSPMEVRAGFYGDGTRCIDATNDDGRYIAAEDVAPDDAELICEAVNSLPTLLAALRSAARVGEWRPIESAPKIDRKRFLVIQDTPGDFEGLITGAHWIAYRDSPGGGFWQPDLSGLMPTRWMPAPAKDAAPTPPAPADDWWRALGCDDQKGLAERIAANVGYSLTPDPEHPDSPHARGQVEPCIPLPADVGSAHECNLTMTDAEAIVQAFSLPPLDLGSVAPASPALDSSPSDRELIEELCEALEGLETANDRLAAGRSQETYDAMLAAGQSDALADLDAARMAARATLLKAKARRAGE